MDISSLGHSAFKLKGKKVTVVCDPFDPAMLGLRFPKNTQAHIVTVSHAHPDHNFVEAVEKFENTEQVVFAGPGEYEAFDIEIVGIDTFHDGKQGAERGKNTVYRIDIDGVKIVHLGDLGHGLTESQAEAIGETDVLLIPVGGTYTIDAAAAVKVIEQIEPSIVIPMHYQVPGMNEKIAVNLSPVAAFLKEMGIDKSEPQSKLTVAKDKLPEELQVVVLE